MILELKSFEMIERWNRPGSFQCVLDFGDELTLSIIKGNGSLSDSTRPYEIAFIKNGKFVGLDGYFSEDEQVLGYLTEAQVNAIIKHVYLLTGTTPCQI